MEEAAFWIFSTLILLTAALVALRPRPIESALWLILNFFFTAGLYVLMGSHFVAVIQVLVYAGAIMVLFVFVILLLNLDPNELGDSKDISKTSMVLFLSFLTFVLLALKMASPSLLQKMKPLPPESTFGSIESLSQVLLRDYVSGFEISGIVLLLAIVGVGLLAFRRPRGELQ